MVFNHFGSQARHLHPIVEPWHSLGKGLYAETSACTATPILSISKLCQCTDHVAIMLPWLVQHKCPKCATHLATRALKSWGGDRLAMCPDIFGVHPNMRKDLWGSVSTPGARRASFLTRALPVTF